MFFLSRERLWLLINSNHRTNGIFQLEVNSDQVKTPFAALTPVRNPWALWKVEFKACILYRFNI